MAYSGIAHAGYLLVGLAAGTAGGLRAAAFYAVAYAIPSMAIMLIVAGVGVRMDDFKGLASRRPYLAWTMTLLLLSLIGVPPLAGFTGKLFVFTAAISGGLLWVAVLGVALSAVAAGFYLRIVRAMFFSEPVGTSIAAAPSPLSVAAILVCAAAVVAVGVMSSPLLSIITFSPR
jgi:NADH-quinone oxidoreductase subunit N